MALSHKGLNEEQRCQNVLYWLTVERRKRDEGGFVDGVGVVKQSLEGYEVWAAQ